LSSALKSLTVNERFKVENYWINLSGAWIATV